MPLDAAASFQHCQERQLIAARDYGEVERLVHDMEPSSVAGYRFSQLRLSLLHLLAEVRSGWWSYETQRVAVARIVRWLVTQRGCDVDALNKAGETPLWLAVSRQSEHMVRALIAAKACVNPSPPPDPWGRSFLHRTRKRSLFDLWPDRPIVLLLMDAGCVGYLHHDSLGLCAKWMAKRAELLGSVYERKAWQP